MAYYQNSNSSWGSGKAHTPYGLYGTEVSPASKSTSMGVSPTMEQHTSWKNTSTGGNGSYLSNKIGKLVKINRGGPESFDGVVVGVQSDYVVLRTKSGLVYVNTNHIKSATDLAGQKSGNQHSTQFIVAASFVDVLRKLNQQFVQINWGGPEKIEGFIAEVSNQSVLLVVGQEKVLIPLFHIRTVKHTGQYASNGSSGSNNNKSGSNNNKSGSNNNKSGSNNNKYGNNNNKSGSKNNKSGSNNNKSGGNKNNSKSASNKNTNKSGSNKSNQKSSGNGNKKR